MRQQSSPPETPSERLVRDIRRATRKQYSAEEKIRIVLDGLRGEVSIAELCRELGLKDHHLNEKMVKLESEMLKLSVYEHAMLISADKQVSLTDPDSRSMATSGRGSGVVGFNVQTVVETENQLIITHDVTNTGSDRGQLARMDKAAQVVLRADKLVAVAYRGYFNSPEILEC
jgi:transposase-like protein